ncbi:hypothetical protein ACQ4PT_050175 [Festuca glaucescens]
MKGSEAEAYVTGAEESATQVGNAEESVTVVSKAAEDAAKTSDAGNVLQAVRVFEDAEYFGAKFESFWNRLFRHYSAYDETTTIPAMCYTHHSDAEVRAMDTLQVVSVKVASIEEDLRWPLQVFGMVSARDVLDRKRNIIFHRERDNCQTITEKDPYLTLTGPSRAVVVRIDPSYIEIVLKVKGATESEDKDTLELSFSQVFNSVEATVHVKVTGGSWPDGFKGVFSAATARTESAKVKLLDVGDDGLPVDAANGTIRLSRRVVSVELDRMLRVSASAYSAAGDEEHCEASFVPEKAASTATQVNLLELQGLVYAKELIVEDAVGAFAKIAVAPLERVKNLLQARTGGFQSLGIIGSLRKLWKYK